MRPKYVTKTPNYIQLPCAIPHKVASATPLLVGELRVFGNHVAQSHHEQIALLRVTSGVRGVSQGASYAPIAD